MVGGGTTTESWYIFIVLILIIIDIEFFIRALVYFVRSRFQWFITPFDENPEILDTERFKEHSYDPEIGWIRKPNTSKEEFGHVYHINDKGSRFNPGHETLSTTISTYGDSFTFCRQNADETTWQWYLSELKKTNVLNFGVGNYGLDQTILRLKREYPKNPTETVIIGVVPSTIVRIMCVWKHYNEYGNVLGYKPRFVLDRGGLTLMPLSSNIEYLRKNDYFYKRKFRKEMLHFPYIYHFFKHPVRNLSIVFWVLLGKKEKAMMAIMKINLKLRVNLFSEKEPVEVLRLLVKEFVNYSKEMNFMPVFMFIPQKDDITYKKRYYKEFLDSLKGVLVLDFANVFGKENIDRLYSDDNEYGGHPNSEGNKLIAETLYGLL